MNILVSNDDGYFSPGIKCLVEALSRYAKVTVVAPERDRSAASNSLTLDRPMNLRQADTGFYFVNGTPTDCVHLALTGPFKHENFDLVVSGINHGANMGDDTLYSGTVAAAMEGFLLGVSGVAFSLAGGKSPKYWETAEKAVHIWMEHYLKKVVSRPFLVNVNIPDTPLDLLKREIRVTRLGKRHQAEPVIEAKNPRGETVYWVGSVSSAQDASEETDFYAVEHGYISLTPLMVDLTAHDERLLWDDWSKA